MFSDKVKALTSRLHKAFTPRALQALQDTFGNAQQPLAHYGPITLQSYGSAPSLLVENRKPEQASLHVNSGDVILGPDSPAGDENPYQTVNNNPVTHNNYVTHNFPVTFQDDIRMGADLIMKYLSAGMGSTIARIKLNDDIQPGKTVQATILDADGNPATNNVSGQGGGTIPVRLPPGFNAPSRSPCLTTSFPSGTYGYAVYFSDTAAGGTLADGATRVNSAQWWEIVSLFDNARPPPTTTINYISGIKVCASTINGQVVVVTCVTKSNKTICAATISDEQGDEDCSSCGSVDSVS